MPTPKTTPVITPADAASAPIAVVETEPLATPDDYDVMSSVFDELTDPPPAPELNEDGTTKVVAEVAQEGDIDTSEPVAKPAVADPAAPAVVETPAVEEPAAAVVEPPAAIDYKAEYEKLLAEKAAVPKPAPASAKKDDDEPAPPKPAAAADVPLYDAAETAALKAYTDEWTEVAAGEKLVRRAEYREIVGYIFDTIAKAYGPHIQRGAQTAEQVSEQATVAYIHETHPDYDSAMFNGIVDWAEKELKGYEKKFALEVLDKGEPEDVVDMITRYKEVKGTTATSAAPAKPTQVAAPVQTERSAAAKKAANALSVVSAKRSVTTPDAKDPNDFDGAWADAMAGNG